MRNRNFTEIKDYNVLAGTSIKEAVVEAINLAEMNSCIVRFNFNDIEMKIYDFSNVENEVNYYYCKLNHKLGDKDEM